MPAVSGTRDVKTESRLLEAFQTRPLSFETNAGQTDARVKFVARRGLSTLFLTGDEAVISLRGTGSSGRATASSVSMKWVGANPSAAVAGVGESQEKVNYLVGNDPEKWRHDLATYAKVQYRGLYPGVDLVYYGEKGNLEYDLDLAPGASPRPVRMMFSGTAKIDIDRAGDLILKVGAEEVRFRKPVAYQTAGVERTPVPVRFIQKGLREVGFEIGNYDHSRALVIDPQLNYSSYLGGSASDGAQRIAVDPSGNAYIVGSSYSTDFPVAGAVQSTNPGTVSAFISKMNPEAAGAASLIYSTYLGGNGSNIGRGLFVDSLGQAYATGDTTATNFPVTTGAYQTTCKLQAGVCTRDAFAVKLNASGNTLLYSTYVGGSGSEYGFAIVPDAAGNIYLGVNTGSSDIPVTAGAFQTAFAGGGAQYGDAWVAKLNPAGQGAADLLYATYLGGSGSEHLYAIALDGTGALCITGSTASANFPTTVSGFSRTYSGSGSLSSGDAFVVRLRPGGQGAADLLYSTFLGGAGDDQAEGIAIDPSNNIYVTGFTVSSAFPVTASTAFQSTFIGGDCGNGSICADAFLARLDPSQSGAASLVYSTFFGGSSFDLGHSVVLDSSGLVYITGETASLNLPLVNPVQNACAAGCTPLPLSDMFIAKFDLSMPKAAGLLFSTYLGGNNVDTGWSIAVDSKGNALVTGQTFSPDLPTRIPFQANCGNCVSFLSSQRSGDAFLVKVCITACPAPSSSPGSLVFGNQINGTASASQPVTLTNTGSGDLTIASIGIAGTNPADFSQSGNCPSILTPGVSCQINVTFKPTALGSRVASVNIVHNASGAAQTIPVSGTGVNATTVTLASSIAASEGSTVTVNSVIQSPPNSQQYTPGSTISVSVPASFISLNNPGVQYVFISWSDAVATPARTITVPGSNTTYTAVYSTQFFVTTHVSPSGSGTLTGGGWINSGTSTTLTATAAGGYQFSGFSGDVVASTSPQTKTVSMPLNVVANFAPQLPRISVTASTTNDSNASTVQIQLVLNNTGLGTAAPLSVDALTAVVISGSGTVTASGLPPAIASLPGGQSATVGPISLAWPVSAKRIRLTVHWTANNGAVQGSQIINLFR